MWRFLAAVYPLFISRVYILQLSNGCTQTPHRENIEIDADIRWIPVGLSCIEVACAVWVSEYSQHDKVTPKSSLHCWSIVAFATNDPSIGLFVSKSNNAIQRRCLSVRVYNDVSIQDFNMRELTRAHRTEWTAAYDGVVLSAINLILLTFDYLKLTIVSYTLDRHCTHPLAGSLGNNKTPFKSAVKFYRQSPTINHTERCTIHSVTRTFLYL